MVTANNICLDDVRIICEEYHSDKVVRQQQGRDTNKEFEDAWNSNLQRRDQLKVLVLMLKVVQDL